MNKYQVTIKHFGKEDKVITAEYTSYDTLGAIIKAIVDLTAEEDLNISEIKINRIK